MSTWPVGFPTRPLSQGYRESEPDTTIESPTDIGPPKRRSIGTAAIEPIRGLTYQFTGAQIGQLRTFFRVDVKGGSIPFDIPHPRTQAIVSAMMGIPTYENVGGDVWHASFDLDVLP